MFQTCGGAVLLIALASAGVVAQARQGGTDEARALYYAADYEKALAALDRVEPADTSEAVTVELLRAASLFALDRSEEGERAFERLVALKSDLLPDQLRMPPWIRSRFAAVRARVLAEMERQNHDENGPQSEPEVRAVEAAPDAQPEFYTRADTSVSPPVPIREHVPEPPPIKGADFSRAVTLLIDIAADGSVEGVTLEGTIHPRVDALIRQAAGTWLYRPATLHGHAVKFRKALRIDFRTTRGHTDCCTAPKCEAQPFSPSLWSASPFSCSTDARVVTTE